MAGETSKHPTTDLVALVAVDFDESLDRLMDAVTRLAVGSAWRLELLHVAAPEPSFVGYDPPGGEHDVPHRVRELTEEQQRLSRRRAKLLAENVPTTTAVIMGPTVSTIIDHARTIGADLIIVAGLGHGWAHRLILGSTAQALTQEADRPVLVIPMR